MSSTVTCKTISSTLVIKKFSKMIECKDVLIKIEGFSSTRFVIRPNAVIFEDAYVFAYWHNEEEAFKFRANVSILNSEGNKLFTKEYYGEFDNENDENLCSLMPRSTLLSPENGYLYNDKLTVLCEFEVIDDDDEQEKTVDTNLLEDFQSLLSGGKFSDFTIVVGKNRKQFNVHKNILAARSPVFAAMFEHDCKEKRQNKVNITDMDEDVCGEMLSYIYTGKVKGLDRYAMELLVVADKYQLQSLKSTCSEYICTHLSVESVVNVLILADLHQELTLKSKCIEFICANVDQVECTDGWKELDTNAKLLKELFAYSAKKK